MRLKMIFAGQKDKFEKYKDKQASLATPKISKDPAP